MRDVLVLGAGHVAQAHVDYLLKKGFLVTVASRTVAKAERILQSHENGSAVSLDLANLNGDASELDKLVSSHHITVSLLPYSFHVAVAKVCLKYKKHLVTTSYVSPEMEALDKDAKSSQVLFLNEVGADPGMDHMSAKKIIDDVHASGKQVIDFRSVAGGLPSPKSNTNPFGYKFSWSPRGVLLASISPAKYLEKDKVIEVPGTDLFADYIIEEIDGIGKFESYPNRNSLPYQKIYGIPESKTLIRGTLRNLGWCPTLKILIDAGYFDQEEKTIMENTSYAKFLSDLLERNFKEIDPSKSLRENLVKVFKLEDKSEILERLEWAGLLGDKIIPFSEESPLDVLSDRLQKVMPLDKGDRDMLIMMHNFVILDPKSGDTEKIRSLYLKYGESDSITAMGKSVGIPAAIACKLILEGKLNITGVHRPVLKEIYEPMLAELKEEKLEFVETVM